MKEETIRRLGRIAQRMLDAPPIPPRVRSDLSDEWKSGFDFGVGECLRYLTVDESTRELLNMQNHPRKFYLLLNNLFEYLDVGHEDGVKACLDQLRAWVK